MARRAGLIAVAVLAAVAVVAVLVWQQRRVDRAEAEAGLASARVLSAVFQRTSALQVARLSGEVQAKAEAKSGYGWFDNRQTTRAPYSVTYTVDLTRLGPSDYRWNSEARTMTVDIPEVTVSAPNVDMAKARVDQTGVYISRSAGQEMQRVAAGRLAASANDKARDPDNLAKARESARASIANLVRGPLAAAGHGDVRVVVRLPGEAKPTELSTEQWDVSRSIQEIYARYGSD